jgi:CBS domain-containing protein
MAMTIAAILSDKGKEVVSVDGATTVGAAVMLLAERRIGAVPVMEGGAIAGIFSERDVIRCFASRGPTVFDAPVREVMTAPALTVAPGDAVLAALSLMTKRRFRHLPVVEGGALVGFVSIGDLVKHRIDRIEAEAQAMRTYIQQV